ncbi:MAG: hypothetical protein MJ106_07340, partial [Lentisphaeria bacterium]|nr:hypothetical protein [Lentisphaeria bacterium]
VRAFTPVQFSILNSQFSINAECRMQNAELIFNAQLMRSDERRVSGSTGVHAALLAPSGAVRAAGSTRRRQ